MVADRVLEIIRVVLVSPSDVANERAVVVTVVEDLNRRIAPSRGCLLRLWRWETDARPGLHLEGPQGLIDERIEIDDADVVIGIFWRRFGTPTGEARSGTEHELRRAWTAWQDHRRPDVMVYFSQQPASPTTSAELEQWERVLRFRDEMPAELLSWSYSTVEEFGALLRGHLEDLLLSRGKPAGGAPPDPPRVPLSSVLEGSWVVEVRHPSGALVQLLDLRVEKSPLGRQCFSATSKAGPAWAAEGTWETPFDDRLVLNGTQLLPQMGPYSQYVTFDVVTPRRLEGTIASGETVVCQRAH